MHFDNPAFYILILFNILSIIILSPVIYNAYYKNNYIEFNKEKIEPEILPNNILEKKQELNSNNNK